MANLDELFIERNGKLKMTFEQFPDELLLMICSYLNPYEILQCFNDLNYRLNCTISCHRQNLDFRSLSLRQFYSYCKLIRFSFGDEVRSLILSNSVPSVRQLVLFRKQIDPLKQFLPNLERIILIDHFDDELDLYLPFISQFNHLKQLKINFLKNQNETTLGTFLSQSLSNNFAFFDHLPKRRKRNSLALEKLSFTGTGFLKLMPIYNETITDLTIEIESLEDLLEIFTGFARLKCLNVNIKELSNCSFNHADFHCDQWKSQCSTLIDFRLQTKWQAEKFSFSQFICLMKTMPKLRYFSSTLKSETSEEKIINSTYVNIDNWRQLCLELTDLLHFDCFIKCPLKSSSSFEIDFLRITANISGHFHRSIDIRLDYYDQIHSNLKSEFPTTLEVDVQELHRTTGLQIAQKLSRSQELTLYSDLIFDDEKISSTFSEFLSLPDRIFPRLRSLDLLGEFPNMNNRFLVTFVEQLLCRAPNLQSIGFFLYWVENMTDLVLTFLRPLKIFLKQIKKCYLYTEGDIDQKFISELASLLPSLTLLSVKIDWYCNTADVVNLCLRHLKDLIHLEIVLEEIPDYLDEDYVDRIKMEKEIESLAMARDTREWLKRNTILGKRTTKKLFQAEKNGNDLKIWL